ncbi:putative secreted protein (Por secretion system target) [Dyadobacter jejuensis]|uniref:Putative secreted protein (Por secretion system target) n=1 Tax=Dyadobacter jejuensis TaxID=1082580 RepID=A0A316AQV9_9BACT|nr:T9SS type A sorting domain-containing protein [Dyadobacter jejuensis]PWJ59992.1 putative secreted protein (Por secretion system target) [Dyadobacter jejuensis]
MDRLVVQRNQSNRATIQVRGSFTSSIDKVEARLVALNGGTSIDWHVLQNNPQGGIFSGSIESDGGWYKLEVRGKLGSTDVGSATVEHVGIGEVFIVSGQSNAQGYANFGIPEVTDDRVNTVNYTNLYDDHVTGLPYPQFSHLDASSQIAPRGLSAWAWGHLGDLLASRLNVPILFFNTGFEGTMVKTWKESITTTAYSPYSGMPYAPSGMPFLNLRWVMQYYVPITGVRAVLWEQGEADNYFATHPIFSTTSDQYAQDLKAVIDANRLESGKDISWVISLSSYDNTRGVNQMVRTGQQTAINTTSNTFQGPDTDVIQIPRSNTFNRGDGVHFTDAGLNSLSQAWNTALTDQFFNNSVPYSAASPLDIAVSCAGSSLQLTATNGGYSSYSWSNGQSGQSVTVGNGTYRVKATDSYGNYVFSSEIKITESIIGPKPVISLEGSNPVCLGNTATLVSSVGSGIRWNTGSVEQRLAVSTGGTFTVTSTSVYGCENTSDPYAVTVLTSPLPDKPAIQVTGATTFCEGGAVQLQSNSKVKNLWSSGATSGSIEVSSSGTFTVKAQDDFGCFSPDSDPVVVKVNPIPAKPQINLSRNPNFCEGEVLTMTSSYDSGNIWSTGSNNKTLDVTTSGTFTLKQRDANGCEASSDPVTTKVNSLPATPSITALKPTTFCERDFTLLQSSPAHIYVWSNGSNNPEIAIYESGEYTISAKDANGCISPPSAVTKVVKNPIPPQPSITALGPTTFCENLSVTLQAPSATSYKWNNGLTTGSITVNSSGSYQVQTGNEFNCFSDPSNTIQTQTLSLPAPPTARLEGPSTFCEGTTTTLSASASGQVVWSDGQDAATITVDQSGSYFAQTIDHQGCRSLSSNVLVIDAKPAPTTPEIEQTGVYTLSAVNNLNSGVYTWQKNGELLSEEGRAIKTAESGTYIVKDAIVYSADLSCSSAYSEPFYFIAQSDAGAMIVYPNPVMDGQITLETLDNLKDATIQIVDIRGIVHKTIPVNELSGQQFIPVSSLPAGTYFIRVLSGSFNGIKKFIVLH